MENNITCFSCDSILDQGYRFCPSCGTNIKCKNCDTLLIKDAKFCFSCGTSIFEENKTTVNNENANTIKFKETKDERSYEVSFTNETASQVTSVVAGMIPNGSNIFKEAVIKNDLLGYNTINDIQQQNEESQKNKIYETSVVVNSDEISGNTVDIEIGNNDIYPHINDLARKYDYFSEKDWILIYAFYLSDFGNKQFTREEVFNKYKVERKTSVRIKNFARSWNDLFKENFSTVKENDLILTKQGLINARGLMNNQTRNVKAKKNTKSNTANQNKSTKTTKQSSVKIEEFDIYEKGGLQSFIEKFNATSTKEYILCIGYFITKILEKESFSDGNVDYAFKVLKLPNRPNALRQIIINIKNNEMWIENAEEKNWKINRTGEIEYERRVNA
ncbi:zinc ribbon domain-containing protein [Chryseobacterium indologenes]|uniref:zinc ribbon domain-containing protein n=1 Tax=Chryseobacterium indologenes TaxID=253 RepID=UPI001F4A5F08|nr:zinc ribbon domain-containing protein [Chryseobacterium indologenes]